MVTLSDRAEGHNDGNGGIDYYIAEVLSQQDYYAFGMQMPYRHVTHGSNVYRYGFNGKENDNDVKGEGNQQDYGIRIYDPRLSRFLSVDPLTGEYPWYSPYQFSGNIAIKTVDVDGLEPGWLPPGQFPTEKDNRSRSESTCIGCASQSTNQQMAERAKERYVPKPAPSISPGKSTNTKGRYNVAPKVDPYVTTIIPQMVAEIQSERAGDGIPIIGPLVQGVRRTSYSVPGAKKSFVTAGVEAGTSLIPVGPIARYLGLIPTTVYRVQRTGQFLELDDLGNVVYNNMNGKSKTVYMFVGDKSSDMAYAAKKPGYTITAFDINSHYARTILRLKHPQYLRFNSISASDIHVTKGYYRIGVHESKIQGFLKWQIPGSGRIINP